LSGEAGKYFGEASFFQYFIYSLKEILGQWYTILLFGIYKFLKKSDDFSCPQIRYRIDIIVVFII